MTTDHPPAADTQAFLSDVADEMEAAATKLETCNGAATSQCSGRRNRYLNANFGSKLIYTASYTLSYGVCFPIFAACRYIPKNNQVVEGMVDGGAAANRAVDDLLNRAHDWQSTRKEASQRTQEDAEMTSAGADCLAPA